MKRKTIDSWLSWLTNTIESQAYNKLGNTYLKQGELISAIDAYHNALKLNPYLAKAHYNLGIALNTQGKVDDAIISYKSSLKLKPDFPEAYNNLGIALKNKGELNAAIDAFNTALQLNPNSPEAHNNLGTILQDKKNLTAAVDAFQAAIQFDPSFAEAHSNLGDTLLEQGNIDAAIVSYKEIIRLNLDKPKDHLKIGIALAKQGNLNAAIISHKNALAIDTAFQASRLNLFQLLLRTKRYEEALKEYQLIDTQNLPARAKAIIFEYQYICLLRMDRYEDALALANDNDDRRLQLINRLHVLPVLYTNNDQIKEVRRRWENDALELYGLLEGIEKSDPGWEMLYAHTWSLNHFHLAYQMEDDRRLQELYAGILDRILRPRLGHFMQPRPQRHPTDASPLRIGVISTNLCNHNGAIWCLGWLEGIAENSSYEVFTYNIGDQIDSGTKRFAKLGVQRHLTIEAENPEQSLQQIIDDHLDLLIYTDIGMHALSKVISVLQLAPVQAQGWGHPITSGSHTIHYFLSGNGMEPEGNEAHYSEELLRLPRTGLNYETPTLVHDGQRLFDQFGLPRDRPILTSLQSAFKYVPRNDYTFAEIAKRHPEAFILLIEYSEGGEISNRLYERLRPHFEHRDLNIERHLRILPKLEPDDYLGLFTIAHHSIDTIDWNGGNSSMQSFSFNCPVVTMPTAFMRGRHTVSMLKVLEIPELIAKDRDDYILISCRLLGDQNFYKSIKERIQKRKHLLFNDKAVAESFRKNVETMCRQRPLVGQQPSQILPLPSTHESAVCPKGFTARVGLKLHSNSSWVDVQRRMQNGEKLSPLLLLGEDAGYVWVPKNGCTTLKAAWLQLQHNSKVEKHDEVHAGVLGETIWCNCDELRSIAHQRKLMVIWRDPIDRFVSACRSNLKNLRNKNMHRKMRSIAPNNNIYQEMIKHQEWLYSKHGVKLLSDNIEPAEAMNDVALHLEAWIACHLDWSHHTLPQVSFLGDNPRIYNSILGMKDINSVISQWGSDAKTILDTDRRHSSAPLAAKDPWRNLQRHNLTIEAVAALEQFYSADRDFIKQTHEQTM